MARRLGKIKSCKNLAKFHARFWQDNVKQEIAKTHYINLAKFLARFWQDHARQPSQEIAKMCYKILAKFLARFWQDHARQSSQEIAKMCYKILAKFLARLRQESCMILVRFGTCNDIHNSIESTALSLSCLTLKLDLYF